MLPLGRKNARRCTECDITCHANCAHLVPDFCGMSMETANALLREAREVSRRKEEQKRRQTQQAGTPRLSPQQPYHAMGGAEHQLPIDQMDRLQISESPQQPPMPDYRQSPVREQVPLPPQALPPGYPQQPQPDRPLRQPMAPPFPTEPQAGYPGRPPPGYGSPPGPDGYQVCVSRAYRRWHTQTQTSLCPRTCRHRHRCHRSRLPSR